MENNWQELATDKCISGLRTYANRITKDRDNAEDLLQDTLLQAYKKLGRFDAGRGGNKTPSQTFFFWCKSLMWRIAQDNYTRPRVETVAIDSLLNDDDDKGDNIPLALIVKDRGPFLSTLSGRTKRLANLLLAGMSKEECAETIGVHRDTVFVECRNIRREFLEFYGIK